MTLPFRAPIPDEHPDQDRHRQEDRRARGHRRRLQGAPRRPPAARAAGAGARKALITTLPARRSCARRPRPTGEPLLGGRALHRTRPPRAPRRAPARGTAGRGDGAKLLEKSIPARGPAPALLASAPSRRRAELPPPGAAGPPPPQPCLRTTSTLTTWRPTSPCWCAAPAEQPQRPISLADQPAARAPAACRARLVITRTPLPADPGRARLGRRGRAARRGRGQGPGWSRRRGAPGALPRVAQGVCVCVRGPAGCCWPGSSLACAGDERLAPDDDEAPAPPAPCAGARQPRRPARQPARREAGPGQQQDHPQGRQGVRAPLGRPFERASCPHASSSVIIAPA